MFQLIGKFLEEASTPQSSNHFLVDGIEVFRRAVQASMSDGEVLFGYCYERSTPTPVGKKVKPSPTPLLCIASELGNSREHHALILAMMSRWDAPRRIYTVDLRGRGLSIAASCANSSAQTDASDLISFCEAHGLHHIDVLVNGRGISVVMLAAPSRPGLVRSLVLNDAAPEFDAVGVAKLATLAKRNQTPRSWDEAVQNLQKNRGSKFPTFDAEDWQELAHTIWADNHGVPAPDLSASLSRNSNSSDLDEKQPTYWREFRLFKNSPVLLVRGANTPLLSAGIVKKMVQELPQLKAIPAQNQGHFPQLHRDDLYTQVVEFLIK